MKALIVEDEIYVMKGLQAMIPWKELGIEQVVTATNGELGWLAFQEHRPDLLITDVYMPKMNGLELIHKVREVDETVGIVILSGYDDFEYAKEAIRFQVSHYILKPAVHTEIVGTLRKVVEDQKLKYKQKRMHEETEERLRANMPTLRNQFLFSLVALGNRERYLEGDLQFYGLDSAILMGGRVIQLLLHRPHDNVKTKRESDWQLMKYAAANIAEEIVKEFAQGYVLPYVEDRLPILLYGDAAAMGIDRIDSLGKRIMQAVAEYVELNSNIGVGRRCEDAGKYPNSYRESLLALRRCDYEGFQRMFYSEEETEGLAKNAAKWNGYPIEQMRQLSEALFRQDRKECFRIWEEIKRFNLGSLDVPARYVQAIGNGIVHQVMSKSLEYERTPLSPEQMIESLQMIQQITTASAFAAWMDGQLSEWLDRLERESGGHIQYVEFVLEEIRERFHENISFEELAKQLHLSRTYLSSLFKRQTGKSFMQYLTQYRIEKAKDLIHQRKYLIYEISEMVGYADPSYFGRVFKMVTGQTLSEYQSMNIGRGRSS